VVLVSAVYNWSTALQWRPPKPQPRRLGGLAALLSQSLTLLPCGAYCGRLHPRGCPFESHPPRTATAPHASPASSPDYVRLQARASLSPCRWRL